MNDEGRKGDGVRYRNRRVTDSVIHIMRVLGAVGVALLALYGVSGQVDWKAVKTSIPGTTAHWIYHWDYEMEPGKLALDALRPFGVAEERRTVRFDSVSVADCEAARIRGDLMGPCPADYMGLVPHDSLIEQWIWTRREPWADSLAGRSYYAFVYDGIVVRRESGWHVPEPLILY